MSRVPTSVQEQHGHISENKSMDGSSTPLPLPVFLEGSGKPTIQVRLHTENIEGVANTSQLLSLQWLASPRLWPRRVPNTTSMQMSLRQLVSLAGLIIVTIFSH
jgi:hypothetical protein